MPRRTVIAVVALGLAGLVAAAGIGIVVNEVSGESIGLAADPLRAGEPLAPAAAERKRGDRKPDGRAKGERKKPKTTTTPTAPATTIAPPPTTTFEDLDDDSGSDDSDNSGPGSDNSGSGSDNSGHGSDDEFEFEDD